jgi:hypothetical protein
MWAEERRVGLPFKQQIRDECLDCIALVSGVATSIGVEVTAHFERIELRVGDVDQPAMEAPALPPAEQPARLALAHSNSFPAQQK